MPRACQSSSSAGPSRRRRAVAAECCQQPTDHVLHVGQALAQIRIGDPAHAVAQVGGNPVHGGLGGQPAADSLGHPPQPA